MPICVWRVQVSHACSVFSSIAFWLIALIQGLPPAQEVNGLAKLANQWVHERHLPLPLHAGSQAQVQKDMFGFSDSC